MTESMYQVLLIQGEFGPSGRMKKAWSQRELVQAPSWPLTSGVSASVRFFLSGTLWSGDAMLLLFSHDSCMQQTVGGVQVPGEGNQPALTPAKRIGFKSGSVLWETGCFMGRGNLRSCEETGCK